VAHCGGNVGLFTIEAGVFLIGQQVFGQLGGVFDGRAAHAVTSETIFEALPVLFILPKDVG
jgi:hypothetical protein